MSRKSQSRKLHRAQAAANASPQGDGSTAPTAAQPRIRWLAPLLVLVFTLAAFLPALQGDFLNWDDDHNFLGNFHYRGLAWPHLRWMWTAFHMGHYLPLTWMTLGLDYLLWGMNPFGYHLTNLLLHAANAAVFYFVTLWILTLALPSPVEEGHAISGFAAFAALLFALHPLRVESVAWITERRDVLSGLFYLLTILVYLRASERPERARWWYWLSVALFGCALLSKSMAVSLPAVLLILDVYPLRRLGGARGWWTEPARRVYAEKIPFVMLAAAISAIAFKALLTVYNSPSLAELSAPSRLAVSAYGLSFYLWKMVVPSTLSPLYRLPPTVNPWAMPFVLSYGLVLGITALALALRRRVPGLLAVWSAYAVVLLPVLGIFQNGPQIAADRYTYLAGLGWAILAAAGLGSGWRALTRSKTGTPTTLALAGTVAAVVVTLGVVTWNQAQVWHDSERLWTHALAIDPNSPIAHTNLGSELFRQGKPGEGIEHFKQTLRITHHAEAHTNWGLALNHLGKPAEAIEHFQQALRINPDLADAHTNWGLALNQLGKPAEAIEHFQQALRINPALADAHTNWGLALHQLGKPAEAIEHFREALRINPDLAEAHNNWGLALGQQAQLDERIGRLLPAAHIEPELLKAARLALAGQATMVEAIDHFQQALRIKPELAEAHYNLGVALTQQGKLAEAIEHLQQAVRLKPDYARAHSHWGLALIQLGKRDEAIAHFREALRINPDLAEAHHNLGLALAQQGGLARSPKGQKAE